MPIQIAGQYDPWEALGTGLGTGLQKGVSERLKEMAELRLKGLQGQALDQLLGGMLGVQAPAAEGVSPGAPAAAAPTQQLQGILGAPIPAQQKMQLAQMAQRQQLAEKKLRLKEKVVGAKERATAFKETKAERKDIVDRAKGDRENNMRIERMETLNESGKLTNPLLYSVLKKAGLDMPVLLTPESQEFRKLTIDFLKDAKKIFGARVTNFEAEKFLESIPSLSQTKEGRRRVIQNLKTMYRASDIREKTMREIIKENDNVPPFDILERVEERAAPAMDDLAMQFKMGLVEPVASEGKLEIGQRLGSLPPASTYPAGTEITNRKTGAVYISNGSAWRKV